MNSAQLFLGSIEMIIIRVKMNKERLILKMLRTPSAESTCSWVMLKRDVSSGEMVMFERQRRSMKSMTKQW